MKSQFGTELIQRAFAQVDRLSFREQQILAHEIVDQSRDGLARCADHVGDRLMRRPRHRQIVTTSSGSVEMMVADRGASSRSAISPKNSPDPSIERMISFPSGEIMVTLTCPSLIRQKMSPLSSAWNTTS